MTLKKVLSAGQCGFDHNAISRTIQKAFDVEVVAADSLDEAMKELRKGSFALVLVNRVFDEDGSSGLELIERIKGDGGSPSVPVMLVSNYEEAQSEAIRAGALPGFGKSALGHPAMMERLRTVLEDKT